MENKEIRTFTDDIEVPAVVQEKADAAFAQIKKERAEAMENKKETEGQKTGKVIKYIKPVIAAAACAVLITGVGISNYGGKNIRNPAEEEAGGNHEKPILDEFVKNNMFTMTAYAQELEPGKPVPLTTSMGSSGRSSVFCGNEYGNVSYCISTEFLCQGENIERISYSINHGAFQVIQPVNSDDRIIMDGQIYNGELNTGSIGGGYDEILEEQPELYETTLYQSFTLAYDKQSAEDTWINICDECPDSGEILDLMWEEGATLEENNDGINKLLDNTLITCTAYYSDGTSQSVDIEVKSQVMTYEEAGEPLGIDEIPGDTRGVFITFEVK